MTSSGALPARQPEMSRYNTLSRADKLNRGGAIIREMAVNTDRLVSPFNEDPFNDGVPITPRSKEVRHALYPIPAGTFYEPKGERYFDKLSNLYKNSSPETVYSIKASQIGPNGSRFNSTKVQENDEILITLEEMQAALTDFSEATKITDPDPFENFLIRHRLFYLHQVVLSAKKEDTGESVASLIGVEQASESENED